MLETGNRSLEGQGLSFSGHEDSISFYLVETS